MHNAVAFLTEANLARNQHLLEFQGNVEKWAADHQQKVQTLEQQEREDRLRMRGLELQLAQAQEELQRMTATVLLPCTPAMRTQCHPSASPSLRNPQPAPGLTTRLTLGNPLSIGPRMQRPPVVPHTPPGWATAPPLRGPLASGGVGEGLPPTNRPPPRSPTPPSPPRAPSWLFRRPSTLPPPGPTPEELARIVVNEVASCVMEGFARTQGNAELRKETVRTS